VTHVTLVEGTWGGTWASDPASPFRDMLRRRDIAAVLFEGWSTDVDGVPNVLAGQKHGDWVAGGYGFSYFLELLAYEDRNVICHSHGLAPVLYGLQKRGAAVPIRRLISVCSPVRDDLQDVADAAKPHIGRWRHISSNHGDPMQRLGELFDGHFTWPFGKAARQWTQADENLSIPGIGHSKLLNDPRFLDLWQADGMLDFLRAQDVGEVHFV
jgi:hypothetical protein